MNVETQHTNMQLVLVRYLSVPLSVPTPRPPIHYGLATDIAHDIRRALIFRLWLYIKDVYNTSS